MRVILVPVADRPECAEALGLAFRLGQRLDAHVCGCHIRPHRHSEVSLPAKFGSPANEDAAWELAMEGKLTEKSSAAARSLFTNVAERHDLQLIKRPRTKPGAVWLEKVGSPNKVLSIMGPVSDLLVVSRPQGKRGKVAHAHRTVEFFSPGPGASATRGPDDRAADLYSLEPKRRSGARRCRRFAFDSGRG
jgi:hypothetical protein